MSYYVFGSRGDVRSAVIGALCNVGNQAFVASAARCERRPVEPAPRKRTFTDATAMSVLCQKRSFTAAIYSLRKVIGTVRGQPSNVTPQTDPLALQFLEKPIMI
jgi:hypothetical protein